MRVSSWSRADVQWCFQRHPGTAMPTLKRSLLLLLAAAAIPLTSAHAQDASSCPKCAQWNVSQQPFPIYGNTYYVGTHGLSSILITSPQGHILIDGDLAESAPKIAASLHTLGFRIEDVKLILNSHVHYDHA